MESLPLDIIKAILCQLPVKDLLRYRSVCKQWYSLIDGPDFIKMHLHHHSVENSSCVLVTVNSKDVTRDLFWVDNLHSRKRSVRLTNPLSDHEGRCTVLGTCNGLLALWTRHDLALWNPSTRRFRKLPKIQREYSVPKISCPSSVVYGFGHDPTNDDYKLVKMAQSLKIFYFEIQVYSTKSNTWKRVGNDLNNYYLNRRQRNGVLLSNALHWLVTRKQINYYLTKISFPLPNTVISFDLMTEEFSEVFLPDFEGNISGIDVGVIGASLCVTFNYLQGDSLVLSVWVMKEYGVKESWTKLFDVLPWNGVNSLGIPVVSLVASSKKNGRDGVILKLSCGWFIWYDLRRKKADKTLVLYGKGTPSSTHMCVGSLVGLENTSIGKLSWERVKCQGKETEAQWANEVKHIGLI